MRQLGWTITRTGVVVALQDAFHDDANNAQHVAHGDCVGIFEDRGRKQPSSDVDRHDDGALQRSWQRRFPRLGEYESLAIVRWS